MKNLFIVFLVIVFAFITTAYIKKQKVAPIEQTTEKKDNKRYCCPKEDFCDSKPGSCPNDKISLIKVGTYYCENDYSKTNEKQGTCSDGKEMKKMEDKSKMDKINIDKKE